MLFELQATLQHGPLVAALASLAVTPVGYAAVAAIFERRLLRARSDFAALICGDPLLAVSIGLGAWLLHGREPAGAAGLPFSLASSTFWLGFGLLQWRAEVRDGFYTRSQAIAPTKIWHQLVVYPLLGYWTWAACLGSLLAPENAATALLQTATKAVEVSCVVAWLGAILYDRRHPKLGHPPYSWRKVCPQPMPWPPQSTSLRAYLTRD